MYNSIARAITDWIGIMVISLSITVIFHIVINLVFYLMDKREDSVKKS